MTSNDNASDDKPESTTKSTAQPSHILSQTALLQTNIFPYTTSAKLHQDILRVATYNIHKGVRGIGPSKRAEYDNLALAIEEFNADLIFLQEVRKLYNRTNISQNLRLSQPQADFLAPQGYISSYMTNAYTREGQHGNALLSRWPVLDMVREDISNNRFEQRGLLHVKVRIAKHILHCIVTHLSLMQASRDWQLQKLVTLIQRDIPHNQPILIAGDFNDWNDKLLAPMKRAGFNTFTPPQDPTFPSFAPMLKLDRMYVRGLTPIDSYVPKGKQWSRISDHLPLIGEFKFND